MSGSPGPDTDRRLGAELTESALQTAPVKEAGPGREALNEMQASADPDLAELWRGIPLGVAPSEARGRDLEAASWVPRAGGVALGRWSLSMIAAFREEPS